ncbi:MAG TPA: hypothetical protein VLF43_01565 [Candidatus Saccharimonadales bacterium]|nr:hypothetical protein [Candidatus Saccharimonadales bacterium]
MVCVYCSKPTQVTNSRLQRQNNHTWRRRACAACNSIFTTIERPDLATAVLVTGKDDKDLSPFNRDRLFVSIYNSCQHRSTALEDASGLTQIVISNLLNSRAKAALVSAAHIAEVTAMALARFDSSAAAVYNAYHPTP